MMYGHDSGTNSGLQLLDLDLLHFCFFCCSSTIALQKCVLVEAKYNNKNTIWFWKSWIKNNVQLEEKVAPWKRRPFTKKWPRNPNGVWHGDVKRTHFATLHQINLGEFIFICKRIRIVLLCNGRESQCEHQLWTQCPPEAVDACRIWVFIQYFTVA